MPDSDGFTSEFCQTFEKEYYHSFHQKIDEEGMLSKLLIRPPYPGYQKQRCYKKEKKYIYIDQYLSWAQMKKANMILTSWNSALPRVSFIQQMQVCFNI